MSPIEKDPAKGYNAAVAAELRAERAMRRMTIDQIVETSDIPKRTLLRLLNTERAINVESLAAIATALRVDPDVILTRALTRMTSEAAASYGLAAQDDAPGRPTRYDDDEAAANPDA